MSKITIHNYESYLLDYSEGTLSALDKIEMELFLKNNPNVVNELIEFSNAPQLSISDIKIPNSLHSHLLKNEFCVSKTEFDTLLIKEIEADLTEDECLVLENNKKNYSYNLEIAFFKQTILEPDLSIVYSNKSNLKKKNKTVALYYYVSVAAMLLVFFCSYYLFNAQQKVTGRGFVKKQFAGLNLKFDKKAVIANEEQVIVANKKQTKPIYRFANTTNLLVEIGPKNEVTTSYDRIISLPIKEITNSNNLDLAFVATENNFKNNEIISQPLASSNSDFLSIKEFINYRIKKSANKNDTEIPVLNKKEKINSLDLASLAINAITSVSPIKLELQKTYAYDGTINEIKLRGENFEWSKKK